MGTLQARDPKTRLATLEIVDKGERKRGRKGKEDKIA